ncbi:MAG: helix-hairpin-helix domain-containing protein [Rubrivivax sp.]|nr:helix-hairpin-helix domain-containing protein [Rubrivivax sp.]
MFRHFFIAILTAISLHAGAAVDVNRANQAELETVKGIGPALSGKILEARKSGAFKDWGDLVERVGGIGEGNASRFSQAGLTVGGAAFTKKPASAPAKADKADKAATK